MQGRSLAGTLNSRKVTNPRSDPVIVRFDVTKLKTANRVLGGSSRDAVSTKYYLMGVVAFEILVDTGGGIDRMGESV